MRRAGGLRSWLRGQTAASAGVGGLVEKTRKRKDSKGEEET